MKVKNTTAVQDLCRGVPVCLPYWLELRAPRQVPPVWQQLISFLTKSTADALGACPPERVCLRVVKGSGRLRFLFELSPDAVTINPEGVSALQADAECLSRLSAHLHSAAEKTEPEHRFDQPKNAPSEGTSWPLRQQSLLPLAPEDEVPFDWTLEGTKEITDAAVKVFSWNEKASADGGRSLGRDSDSASRILALMKRLKSAGPDRPLRRPINHWESALDQLAADFPNFANLIEAVIRPHLALLSRGRMHRMSNVLLVGPPGIGKTFFSQQLAEVMAVGRPLFVPMAAETNGSSLAGSSTFWSNSAPGRLFERLAWGEGGSAAVANPLVILDEVDKTVSDRFDPLGPLYSLLEAETARSFQDQSLSDVHINASHVRFMATANDLSGIPAPLLSRMLVFQIALPAVDQLQRVVRRIHEGVARNLGVFPPGDLPYEVLKRACRLSPREIKVRLECAFARAISAERHHILLDDWMDIDLGAGRSKSIGFTTN